MFNQFKNITFLTKGIFLVPLLFFFFGFFFENDVLASTNWCREDCNSFLEGTVCCGADLSPDVDRSRTYHDKKYYIFECRGSRWTKITWNQFCDASCVTINPYEIGNKEAYCNCPESFGNYPASTHGQNVCVNDDLHKCTDGTTEFVQECDYGCDPNKRECYKGEEDAPPPHIPSALICHKHISATLDGKVKPCSGGFCACGQDTQPKKDSDVIYKCVDQGGLSGYAWIKEKPCNPSAYAGASPYTVCRQAECVPEDEDDRDDVPSNSVNCTEHHVACYNEIRDVHRIKEDNATSEVKSNSIYKCVKEDNQLVWERQGYCNLGCENSTCLVESTDFVPNQPRDTGPPPDAPPPPELDGMWGIIARGFNFFLGLIVVAVAAMFVYGAYMWMFSMGEPENVKRAQGILTWAVVGLVFYMIMRLILGFLLNLLGIDGLPGVTI